MDAEFIAALGEAAALTHEASSPMKAQTKACQRSDASWSLVRCFCRVSEELRMFKKIVSGAVAALGSVAAFAEVPAGFATAVTTYQTDCVAGIALLIAAGIVVYGAKKLGSKLGLL